MNDPGHSATWVPEVPKLNRFRDRQASHGPPSFRQSGPFTVNSNTFGEAYALTAILSGLQANSSFTITLWASDGTTKQTESPRVNPLEARHRICKRATGE